MGPLKWGPQLNWKSVTMASKFHLSFFPNFKLILHEPHMRAAWKAEFSWGFCLWLQHRKQLFLFADMMILLSIISLVLIFLHCLVWYDLAPGNFIVLRSEREFFCSCSKYSLHIVLQLWMFVCGFFLG